MRTSRINNVRRIVVRRMSVTNNLSHLWRRCKIMIRTLARNMITPGATGTLTFTVLPMMVPLTIVALTTKSTRRHIIPNLALDRQSSGAFGRKRKRRRRLKFAFHAAWTLGMRGSGLQKIIGKVSN